jgi:hypothetical protein
LRFHPDATELLEKACVFVTQDFHLTLKVLDHFLEAIDL